MRRISRARLIALVTAGAVAASVVGAVSASVSVTSAEASSIVSTPGVVTAKVGDFPTSEAVSPDNRWLYVGSAYRSTITAIDVHMKKVVATIAMPSGVGDIAFSRTGSHAYVTTGTAVDVVDTSTRKITAKVKDPTGSDSITRETGGRYLLMQQSRTGAAARFDTQSNKITVIPTSVTDNGAAFSADGADLFGLVPDDDTQTTDFVHTKVSSGKIVARATLWSQELSSDRLAASADGSVVAVMEPDADDGTSTVDIINPATATVLRKATLPSGGFSNVQVSPDGSAVTIQLGQAIWIVDATTARVRGDVGLAAPRPAWSFSPDGNSIYATQIGPAIDGDSVVEISLSDARVLQTLKVQKSPNLAIPSITGKTAYVLNYKSASVSLVSLGGSGWRPATTQDWGSDRYGSSVVESRLTNTQQRKATFITSDVDPALTLGVAALAASAQENQFLVISPRGASSSAVAEIKRVKSSHVYVVGDDHIVSASAYAALSKTFGSKLSRVAGGNSSETLLAMEKSSDAFRGSEDSEIYVADSRSYAAALAAPATAGYVGDDYLLVDGSKAVLSSPVRDYLTTLNSQNPLTFVVLGTDKTISAGIASDLASFGSVKRLAGADRYAIAQSLNSEPGGTPGSVLAVNGDDVVDAAMAAGRARKMGGIVDLVKSTCVPEASIGEWLGAPATNLALMGSPAQLGPGIAALKRCP